MPPFAVLFKVHFWDDFCARQYNRLLARAAGGDVFIICDETQGPVHGIPDVRQLRLTEQSVEDQLCLPHPPGRIFWYNADYQLYKFCELYPDYEYIFICEYDCVLNIDLHQIISKMAADRLDFVGERNRDPFKTWHWRHAVQAFYEETADLSGRLICCAAFSCSFIFFLKLARQDLTKRYLSGQVTYAEDMPAHLFWPHVEGFIGGELSRLGLRHAPLSAFGDISCYDWAPPHLEVDLGRLTHSIAIHPVLDGPKFLQSHSWKPTDLFIPNSRLANRLQNTDPAYLMPLLIEHFVRSRDTAAIANLKIYAQDRLASQTRALFNVAKGKPCTQSSVSKWSSSPNPAQDAAGAVTGTITGHWGFHTNLEPPAWWCVDLQAHYPVREIVIHNSREMSAHANSIKIDVSPDLLTWRTVFSAADTPNFGITSDWPLTITFDTETWLRFVHVSLTTKEVLHLDELEVFI
jgi:hypothetical protein